MARGRQVASRAKSKRTTASKSATKSKSAAKSKSVAAAISAPTLSGDAAKRVAELEREISADPTKPEPYMVLADELIAAGDPRGELIALQDAQRRKPSVKLAKREAEVLEQMRPQWFGELATLAAHKQTKQGRPSLHLGWFQGHVRSARLDADAEDPTTAVADVLPALLKLPIAKFLTELAFGNIDCEYTNPDYGAAIEMLAKIDRLPPITSVFFGDFELEDDHELTWNTIGRFDLLSKTLPGLERLRVHSAGDRLAGPMDLSKLALPRLRDLEVFTDYSDGGELVRQIIGKKMPLERLAMSFGVNGGDEPTLDDVKPILDGKLPLKSLWLEWIGFGPALVEALPKSKLAATLEHLTLRSVHLHDTAIASLAKLPALKSLDVDCNYFTKPAQKQLKKLCKQVEVGLQWNPKDDYRLDD